MIININKDFEKTYKDDAWRGFSLKELISIIAFVVVIGGCCYGLYRTFQLDPSVGVYLSMPLAAVFLAPGFFRYQDMEILELIQEYIFENRTRILCFDSEEGTEVHVFSLETREQPGISKEVWKQWKKKHKSKRKRKEK